MFDRSLGGTTETNWALDRKPNQDMCPHVWGREPINVGIQFTTDEEFGSTLGKAFKCTVCDAYLVLHDRVG